jgi:hypothetical protein
VEVSVPYAALDLDISLPILQEVPRSKSQKYFPIKRAWKDEQHTLGRMFLQEAYLQVDYHKQEPMGSIGPLVRVGQDYVVQLQEMYTHQDTVELPAEELGYQPSMLKSSRVPSPSVSEPAAIQDV